MRLKDFEPLRLDELAPATLASYKTKAGAAATAADAAGDVKTADRRFSGIVKATKKQFDQDAKGVSEDSDDTVRFEVDSENAYNHVMDQFGSVIDWDGDTMVAPRKYWGAIQELALAASGEASEEHGLAEGSLKEFAIPGGSDGDSERWYTDGELADIIGDDWFEDFDVSNDGFNIDAYGEKAKKNLVGYANAWFNDKGYNVDVMGVEHNDVDHDLQWYIVGSFHNPRFANEGVAEGLAADGSVNYTLGHTPDAEYVYHIYRDGKKEGTYHSVDQAREIMGNMMLTRPNREYKIKRGTRNKMAGPTGQLPEQGVAEGLLNEERDARIKKIQELSEGLTMNDLAKVPMFVVDSFKKAAFATEREAIETKNAIKTVFNWSQSTPEQKQAAKKQMHDIAKIAAGLAIAGAVGHVGAAALGVGHAATTVGAVAQTAIEHIIADLGIEAVAGILGAGGINIVKNALHDITTSSGHEFEKQQYQQGVKQRIKTQPMAGPAGHLPEQTVAEDALAGMKRLAGIAPITTQTTPGQRQYRHMPTAVQSR